MTEISKEMKILLLIDAIIAIIYGILYLIVPEVTLGLRDATNYDPQFWRIFGATVISFAIFLLIANRRSQWENIKILIELILFWLILILIVNFINLATVPYSTIGLASQWLDNILIILLVVVNSYFYMRESKKT